MTEIQAPQIQTINEPLLVLPPNTLSLEALVTILMAVTIMPKIY